MSEPLDFYREQITGQISDISWLAALQNEALIDFDRVEFPTRYQEDWKYTPIAPFLKQLFSKSPQSQQLNEQALAAMAMGRQTDVPIGKKMAIVNGVVIGFETLSSSFPPGVIVKPLRQAIAEHAELIKPYLGKILRHDHGFQALNTAMLQSGLFIYVPKNVHLAEPLLLTHWQTTSNQAVYLRHLVVADAGSKIDIIEDYQGDGDACYFTNSMTEIAAAANASVRHYKIQRESKRAFHVGHLAVSLKAESLVESHLVNFGALWSRCDVTLNLDEPSATCILNGIYAPNDNQHMDQHTSVNHLVASCRSMQDYKGIVSGQAKAVFNGKVHVAKDAQATEAKQQNKNLLLSHLAEINTKPQLDIFADNVMCTHGATVGQLDEDALFYLATRGIDQAEANRYLIQAFAADNLAGMANQSLATWISGLLGACYENKAIINNP